jgi:hypothetical protein
MDTTYSIPLHKFRAMAAVKADGTRSESEIDSPHEVAAFLRFAGTVTDGVEYNSL